MPREQDKSSASPPAGPRVERSGRACVIGAGCSGLTAVKALVDEGLEVECFERSDRVGGNWVFGNKNGHNRIYRSLHINTSRQRMQFDDFPMPADYPD
jgi:cation diffusion facilitator CzcD-associated flavoprotein CzcO